MKSEFGSLNVELRKKSGKWKSIPDFQLST